MGRRVSVLWLKNFAGLFLLPVAWVWTLSFFGLLARETVQHRFWSTEEFRCFTFGALLWGLCFGTGIYWRGEPWPLRVYVFGHELTHAVWAWLFHGKVHEFRVSREGGHILTDKPNLWVTLAPYFYPIYSVALVVGFFFACLLFDFKAGPLDWWRGAPSPLGFFILFLGASWSFHFTFTIWMIARGQSDLRMHGNFFSIVLIYIMNLVLLSLHLAIALPHAGFRVFGAELLRHSEDFSDAVWRFFAGMLHRL